MKKFNLKETEEQQVVLGYLKPINQEIFSLVSYINYFQTPYEEKDGCSQMEVWDSTLNDYVTWVDNNELPINVRIPLTSLSFREYIVSSTEGDDLYINSASEPISSKIGIYMGLTRVEPVDSDDTRASYDAFEYVYLPYSNGSYYMPAYNSNGLGFIFSDGAVQQKGKTMIFTSGGWPLRYIYEKQYSIQLKQYSVFNYNNGLYIKDVNNFLWDSPQKTAFAELYYEDEDNHTFELLVADTKYEINEVKLLDTNSIFYNITAEDLLPAKTILEVY